MYLSRNAVLFYLMDHNLLNARDLVEDGVLVSDVSSRNRNYKVFRETSEGYFIKQLREPEPQLMESLQHEARCYWLAQNHPGFDFLLSMMPEFHRYDAEKRMLILGLIRGQSIRDSMPEPGRVPIHSAIALGKRLGSFHRSGRSKRNEIASSGIFSGRTPWILSFPFFQQTEMKATSPANSHLLQIVQRFPEFQSFFSDLLTNWKRETLIHADIKWENCVVTSKDDSASVQLIDWELCEWGDWRWDLGSVLQGFVSDWILSLQIAPGIAPSSVEASASKPLQEMQPVIREFWKAYTQEMPELTTRRNCEYAASFAAARMIQTAYEYMFQSSNLTTNAIYLLQLSLNILQRPADALIDLFGVL